LILGGGVGLTPGRPRDRREGGACQGGEGPPRIVWEGACDLSADDILARQDRAHRGGGAAEERATATDAAETWLMVYLDERGGEAPASELLAAGLLTGHSGRALRRARERLGIAARRVGEAGRQGGGEWLWRATKTPRPAAADGPGQVEAPRTSSRAPKPANGTSGVSKSARQAELRAPV
jgi:hypothetical protein